MSTHLRIIATTVTLLTTSLSIRAIPVDGQIFQFADNGHFYSWIDNPLSWPDANTAANTHSVIHNANLLDNWHLATITSQAENDFLTQTVLGLPDSYLGQIGDQRAWIGLFNEFGANNFEWVTGESTSYTNWFSGEPNNSNGTVATLGRYANGQWNDEFNDPNNGGFGPLAYLVEHDGVAIVPLPAAVWLFGSVALAGFIGMPRRRKQV